MIVWNEKQQELAENVAKWGEVLSRDHIELEKSGTFCRDKWQFLSEKGFLGIPFDVEYNGIGEDLLTTMYLLEKLGYVCEDGGFNFVVTSHMVSTGVVLNRFGCTYQKEQYLGGVCDGRIIGAHAITEPESGSDAFSMRTKARQVDGGFKLSGSKTFTSNAPIADIIVVYAMTNPELGALGGCTVFLVATDSPGLTIGQPLEKLGLKNAPMAELFFDDCFVPDSCIVGKVGDGFSIFQYVMKWEVLCSFIVNVGEMQRRFEKCSAYAKSRKQFGVKIGKFQSISHSLVDMKIDLETSRDWLYKAGARFQNGKNATNDIAIAKLVCSEANFLSATKAVRIFGGYGYMAEYGLEKEFRQSIGGTIYSGSSEVTRNRIANNLGL